MAGPLAGVEEVDLWGAGKTGKPWLHWLRSQGVRVRVVYDIDPRKIGQEIAGSPVRHPDEIPAADGRVILVAVGAEGAREVITPQLAARGYTVGEGAWLVA